MVTRRQLIVAGSAGLILPPALLLPRRTSAARLLSRGSSGGGGASYNAANRISGLRSHATIGSFLTANDANHPKADGGIQLPTAPTLTSTQNPSSLGDAQTYMNSSGVDVTLTPGTYNGNITISTGTHNRLTITGCTINGDIWINGGSACHHLVLNGGTVNGMVRAWKNAADSSDYASHLHLKDMTVTYSADTEDIVWMADFLLIENSTIDHTSGGIALITEQFCTNILVMNSHLRAWQDSPTAFEPTFRAHGSHMFFSIDSRLETYGTDTTKSNWRSHHGTDIDGGTNGCINCQVENGGFLCDNAGAAWETVNNKQLVFVDINYYQPAAVAGGGGWNIPNTGPDELNTNLYGLRLHHYWDGASPETAISGLNPPGTRSDCVVKDYTSTPAWPGPYTSTPVTAAE